MQADEHEAERTCKIPKIYPFQDSTLTLIRTQIARKNLKPPPCFQTPSWFKTNLESKLIRLNETGSHWDVVDCCYIPFTTVENYKYM